MNDARSAAIVTVGTELVRGLAIDTNTSEIARALDAAGVEVAETISVGDDESILAAHLARCTASYDVVVVTGGLGPTHDDVTREAAAQALNRPILRDASLLDELHPAAARHADPDAAAQVYRQADVIEGARVLPAVLGTAPGQVLETERGMLVLLPGPPREMRPLLANALSCLAGAYAEPRVLRSTGLPESEVQLLAQAELEGRTDIVLTVLAKPGDVWVVLFDRGAGGAALDGAAERIASRLGVHCYSRDGRSLGETVVNLAREGGRTIATAESCTGGLIGGELTSVPGSSDVFVGGVISYSNDVKVSVLGVDPSLIDALGAVSDAVAMAMAVGARAVTGSDLAVAVTGVAGPDGGTIDKPVGTVWFAVADESGCRAELRRFPGDRHAVRERAVLTALDLVRRALLSDQ